MAQESALQKVMGGQELSDKQTKGALAEAVEKLGKEGGKLSKLKENMGNLGDAMITTGETQGTVFVASFAEGYLGEDKMDVGPVDLRLAGGVASAGYGLYNVMMGKGGEHALAVGNGLLATAISRVGRNAGKALAEKRHPKEDKPSPVAETPAPAAAPGNKVLPAGDAAEGEIGDFVRDIFLTPDERTEGRRGARAERSKPTRFIRATAAR